MPTFLLAPSIQAYYKDQKCLPGTSISFFDPSTEKLHSGDKLLIKDPINLDTSFVHLADVWDAYLKSEQPKKKITPYRLSFWPAGERPMPRIDLLDFGQQKGEIDLKAVAPQSPEFNIGSLKTILMQMLKGHGSSSLYSLSFDIHIMLQDCAEQINSGDLSPEQSINDLILPQKDLIERVRAQFHRSLSYFRYLPHAWQISSKIAFLESLDKLLNEPSKYLSLWKPQPLISEAFALHTTLSSISRTLTP